MARRCDGGGAGVLRFGLGALVPLASSAKLVRFWYDFPSCRFGVLDEGRTWVSSFDRFATDKPRPTSPGPAASAPATDAPRTWR